MEDNFTPDENPLNPELEKLLQDFTQEMRKRLIKKQREGFSGWGTWPVGYLHRRVKTKVAYLLRKPNKEAVDVANLVMMIWNQNGGRDWDV